MSPRPKIRTECLEIPTGWGPFSSGYAIPADDPFFLGSGLVAEIDCLVIRERTDSPPRYSINGQDKCGARLARTTAQHRHRLHPGSWPPLIFK